MNYPFSKKSSLGRFVSLTMAAALIVTTLTGCSLIPGMGKTTEPSSEPSTEAPAPSLNLIEKPEETEAPSTVATIPTTEKRDNIAIVKEQLSLRSSPSAGSRVIATLDAGEEVEVSRIEPIGATEWAFVTPDSVGVPGWVVTSMLDLSDVKLPSGGGSTPANTTPTIPTPATQPTAPTVNNITGTGTGTTPANSQVATVNTNTLNIRENPSTSADRVGQYTFGDRITILETQNGWGRTNKGWISLNYVTFQQSTSTGTVTGTNVNIRSGAGTNNGIVGSYTKGDVVTILETTSVGTTQWGRTDKGWISLDYVNMGGSTGTGAIGNPTPSNGNATITTEALNIRTGAGTNYAVAGTLKMGDVVNILETVNAEGMTWGRIDRGWISMTYVRMN